MADSAEQKLLDHVQRLCREADEVTLETALKEIKEHGVKVAAQTLHRPGVCWWQRGLEHGKAGPVPVSLARRPCCDWNCVCRPFLAATDCPVGRHAPWHGAEEGATVSQRVHVIGTRNFRRTDASWCWCRTLRGCDAPLPSLLPCR